MELRLPLEMSPGREAACRAVFGTWGFFPNDARKNCPFVWTSFTGWSLERCPGIGFLSRQDRVGVAHADVAQLVDDGRQEVAGGEPEPGGVADRDGDRLPRAHDLAKRRAGSRPPEQRAG